MFSKTILKSCVNFTKNSVKISKNAQNLIKITNNQLYKFSGAIEKSGEKSKVKLYKGLQKELEFEKKNYQEDETVDSTLRETGFALEENELNNNLELVKTSGSTKVTISFTSRAPQFNEENEEGQQQEQEGEEDQQQDYQDYCDFSVFLTKKDGSTLAYECSSYDSEISINNITLINDIEAYKKTPRYERMTTNYNGPEFNTLDERLQSSLIEYLKSFGVTEEVAALVEHLSLDKEQRLYMNWLHQVSDFVNTD